MTKLVYFIKIVIPLLLISVNLENVHCYSKISFNGFNNTNDERPKIYKATNLDLLFQKKDNSNSTSWTTTTTAPPQTSPTQQASASSSSWPSFQQPPIFITPLNEHLRMKTTTTTTTTPRNHELISTAQKPLVVAETYALTKKFPDHKFQANKTFEEKILSPTQMKLTNDEQLESKKAKISQYQQLKSQGTPQQLPGLSHKMLQKQQQLLRTTKMPKQQHLYNRFFTSTGRAASSQIHYPFGQFITPLPTNAKPPAVKGHRHHHNYNYHHQQRPLSRPATPSPGKIVYTGNSYRARYPSQRRPSFKTAKDKTIDRFSPSEAVVSHNLKNQHLHYKPGPSSNFKTPAVDSPHQISSYIPPKELYSFPPNTDSKYPMPSEDSKATVPASSVNSYLPPPSGPLPNADVYQTMQASDEGKAPTNDGGYVYNGPVNPSYVPPPDMSEGEEEPKESNNDNGHDSSQENDENNVGVLPANAMESSNSDTSNLSDMETLSENTYEHNSHDHDHPLEPVESDKEYPTPPPGWLEENPKEMADNKPPQAMPPPKLNQNAQPIFYHHDDGDHHHHLHHLPTFPIYPYHKPYPELIYDDFHHHHHHHPHIHQPEPEIKTTTPPSPEPRVKKYSYFYIGRKLWYIPLYFTVWFSFYVLWLIVKSIARHKVNLPNHYVSRRSLPWDLLNQNSSEEYIDELTKTFFNSIERFRKTYLS